MCSNPTITASEINCQQYEVLACEPLHDNTNFAQNIINELPSHIDNKEIKKQYEQFCSQIVGEKNKIKGSDARLYGVKLAKFTQTMFQDGKVNNDILTICNSLAEIINICYDSYTRRTPKQILRLHNLRYLFSNTCISVIGNPNTMSERKFYGNHFQSNHTCS